MWGSFGKQVVDVGVVGFYQPTPACQGFRTASVALAASIEDVNACLNTDQTLLQTTNLTIARSGPGSRWGSTTSGGSTATSSSRI
jgi:hypothetical protein